MKQFGSNTERKHRTRPELLAPAGNMEALKAACAYGADAVYFGLSSLNARLRAGNFTEEGLPELMEYLHTRNVRGYLTLNTLVYQHELAEAERIVRSAARAGVDAIIVQDQGLAALAARCAPTLPLHASTQMSLSTPNAFRSAAERLGISRVILPRELPLSEIRRIAAASDIELEVFVHGALCISYSGQCQASLVMGGRSANRGECAQPCRLPYTPIIDGTAATDARRQYPLSPCDMAAWPLLPDLIEAGIVSFKIEGRLKNAAYVAAAVRLYRAAIDAALAGSDFTPDAEDESALRQTFSRGFSTAFMGGVEPEVLVSGLPPQPHGLRVGTLLELRSETLLLRIESAEGDSAAMLRPGDGVVFTWGEDGTQCGGGRIESVRPVINRGAKAGQCGRMLEISLWNRSADRPEIKVGAVLWKTDDPRREKTLKAGYIKEKAFHLEPLEILVEALPGSRLRTLWKNSNGEGVEVFSDQSLTPAERHPLNAETLQEQLGRLGDTPFRLDKVEFVAPEAVMLPLSALNKVRREAVMRLVEMRRQSARHALASEEVLAEMQNELRRVNRPESEVRLSVLARSSEQARALLPSAASAGIFVWLELPDNAELSAVAAEFRSAGLPFGAVTPRITRIDDEVRLADLLEQKPAAFLLRSAAAMAFFASRPEKPALEGDAFLHCANSLSAALLLQAGLGRITPACELNPDDIIRLAQLTDPAMLEVPLYARLPMFHSEHCLFASLTAKATQDGGKCATTCRGIRLELLDRKGAKHTVWADEHCRNTVYSALPRDWRGEAQRFRAAGICNFRIELLNEDARQTLMLLESLKSLMQ